MKIKIFKKGFNFSQDGPGNRLVYHMQGCNMFCPWCSNPEGININNLYIEYEINELIKEILSCCLMFYDGGGVTFTGGEPTMQFDVLKEALKKLNELGIHAAVETNGTHPNLPQLFKYINYLIMDFKHYDNKTHTEITGIENVIIKKNIKNASLGCKSLLIRTPLIKGFNSSENDAAEFVKFFNELNCTNVSFEFLKYHEFGKIKWEQCGMEYMIDKPFVDDKTVEMFESLYQKNNLKIIRT